MTNALMSTALLAIDVGSSRVKLGWYAPGDGGQPTSGELPQPDAMLELAGGSEAEGLDAEALAAWLDTLPCEGARCFISSVRRSTAQQMGELLAGRGFAELRELQHADLPITNRTREPERVGIDRLLAGVAANRLRRPDHAAVVVDAGSAVTVDFVSAEGHFEGGAILPGIALGARALQAGTDVLPQVELASDEPPPAVGKSTHEAIAAGLHWGAVGAVREIVTRIAQTVSQPVELFVTGGDGSRIADSLSTADLPAQCHANLVLAGIWIVA